MLDCTLTPEIEAVRNTRFALPLPAGEGIKGRGIDGQ